MTDSVGAIGRDVRYLSDEVPEQLSQRNHAAPRDAAAVDGWHELAVANPTFLLERLGTECTDLQGLRELTVNGLDAINGQDSVAGGRVVWDLDWLRFDASGGTVRKLSVTDTGTGMTPEQLRQYINQLASSGRDQSAAANFGVGAKIAAGSRNPHGLEYRSWHRGQGALVRFKRHPDGRWGLEPQRWPDGRNEFWRPLGEQEKPWLLRGLDNGTQVVLLGRHERHDTIQAPDSVTDGRRRWITRYLNGRSCDSPSRSRCSCATSKANRESCSASTGSSTTSSSARLRPGPCSWATRSPAGGYSTTTIAAGGAKARCGPRPVTPPPCSAMSSTTSCRKPVAGTGAFRTSASASATNASYYTSNRTSRLTGSSATPPELVLDHEPLPWARWVRSSLPQCPQRSNGCKRAASADAVPRQEAIRQRVTAIMPLYCLSRYRPPHPLRVPGTVSAIDEPMRSQHDSPAARKARVSTDTTGTSLNTNDRADRASSEADEEHTEPPVDLPDVAWISGRYGTRAVGDLEDQAARYHLSRHELTINADFRGITDLIGHWCRRYQGVPSARTVIEGQVHEWCEQVLVELVLAARSSSWTVKQLDALSLRQLAHRRPASAPHAARGPAEATRAEARNPKTMIETTTASASSWAPTGPMLDSHS